jgi:hypothetical protein
VLLIIVFALTRRLIGGNRMDRWTRRMFVPYQVRSGAFLLDIKLYMGMARITEFRVCDAHSLR